MLDIHFTGALTFLLLSSKSLDLEMFGLEIFNLEVKEVITRFL